MAEERDCGAIYERPVSRSGRVSADDDKLKCGVLCVIIITQVFTKFIDTATMTLVETWWKLKSGVAVAFTDIRVLIAENSQTCWKLCL